MAFRYVKLYVLKIRRFFFFCFVVGNRIKVMCNFVHNWSSFFRVRQEAQLILGVERQENLLDGTRIYFPNSSLHRHKVFIMTRRIVQSWSVPHPTNGIFPYRRITVQQQESPLYKSYLVDRNQRRIWDKSFLRLSTDEL